MNYRELGSTGIMVSELCYGTLTASPLQLNLDKEKAGELMDYALSRGVNFFDTSEFYRNYSQIRDGLGNAVGNVVISTKTYAYTAQMARECVNRALSELGRDYIDLVCLHEQESELTLQGHRGALDELVRCKEEGLIRAVGISTHHIAAAEAALNHPEIEVVMAVTNRRGLGVADGSMVEMEAVIRQLRAAGKGVYGMKVLGGGNLTGSVEDAFTYVRDELDLCSAALGFQEINEIRVAADWWDGKPFNAAVQAQVSREERLLHVADWCTGCGLCVDRCDHRALSIVDGRALVDPQKCLRCGYCSAACPEFCLKIY